MPERQCTGCDHKEEWGCWARQVRQPLPDEDPRDSWDNPAWLPLMIDDEDYYGCPRQTILEEPQQWARLLKLYGFYKQGFLPDRGSIVDQSNSLLTMFRILDHAHSECDKAESDKRTRKKGDPFSGG